MITKVLITFPERPLKDYPLSVRIYTDKDPSGIPQDHYVKNMREARIFGNGACAMLHYTGRDDGPINPEIDSRLIET